MNTSRREFFKKALATMGAAVAAPALLKTMMPSFAMAADVKFVTPGQGMAASVNYTEAKDRAKVKKELQIERSGVKFAGQQCSGCQLYTKDAAGNYGKCALFPNEFVKPDSWCASWSKKG